MQKFVLYEKAREVNKEIVAFLNEKKADRFKADQLRRCSMSTVLNIAEGNARFTSKDRLHFFAIARGSATEARALFDMLEDEGVLTKQRADQYRRGLTEIIKISTVIVGNLMIKIKQKKP